MTPCRPWTGTTNGRGYGRIRVNGRYQSTHRLAWAQENGLDYHDPAMPPVVRHLCHNPPCREPTHLAGGTHADNTHDAALRGTLRTPRHPPGDQHPRAKLTADAVEQIRRSAEPAAELAARYGVTPACIRHARNGRTWAQAAMPPHKARHPVMLNP
jgi:hypothetical protein